MNVEALLRLVTELNASTRFHAKRMRVPGDVTGADNVVCWQTGFPFSVNLSRGYPRYNPGEYSANDMLERGEVDACLFVGSEGISAMSPQAVSHLKRIPTIALDHPTVESAIHQRFASRRPFTASIFREPHIGWMKCRSRCGKLLPARYPSDADVLNRIHERVTGR